MANVSAIFGFGKASDLSSRTLTIHRISDDPATVVHNNAYSAGTEVSDQVELTVGRYRVALVDVRDNGSSRRMVGIFSTEDAWPKELDSPLRLLSFEDMSSSSSLSSSSSSS